jgi:AraC-like DNA-binding protein
MDALSDVLRFVRLTGGVFLDSEFSSPWCVISQVEPADCRGLISNPAHLIGFHYILSGRALVRVEGGSTIEVEAGEAVLLPRNDPHLLGSALDVAPIKANDLITPPPAGGLARLVHGGGGATTRVVCGFLGSEIRHDAFVATLPKVLKLDLRNGAAGDWVESSFRFAARELAAGRAGSETILSRISELLFVEAMRSYITSLPAEERGWLAGLRDPYVGRALTLMHSRPAENWTAEALAGEVGLSRSAFADRFTDLIGEPPMRYLATWRMRRAAGQLLDGRVPIARIAYDVGYESEAAFNRAFKREFGIPPATWRKQRQA